MNSTLIFSSSSSHHPSLFFSNFKTLKPLNPKARIFTRKKPFSNLNPLRISHPTIQCCANTKPTSSKPVNNVKNGFLIAKPLAFALFYVVVGLICPVFGFRKPAFAAAANVAAADLFERQESEEKGHKYSYLTRKLLEVVSRRVVKVIEASKGGSEEETGFVVKRVEEGLKEVKSTRKQLQEELMSSLYKELRVLRGEKEELTNRYEEIVERVFREKREEEGLLRKSRGGGGGDRVERIREERGVLELEYNEIWERIGEIDDLIARKEFLALSIGVRELSFIERECEALVEGFVKRMKMNNSARLTTIAFICF